MIPAGQRNQLIKIQASTPVNDPLGQPTESWADVASPWARARPVRGREFFSADAVQAEGAVVFGFNWISGIDSKMRVLWREVPYAIVADPVDVDGGRHTMELICRSGPRADT